MAFKFTEEQLNTLEKTGGNNFQMRFPNIIGLFLQK